MCLQRTEDESINRVRYCIFIVLLGTSSLIFIKFNAFAVCTMLRLPHEGTRNALDPPCRDRAVRSRDVHFCYPKHRNRDHVIPRLQRSLAVGISGCGCLRSWHGDRRQPMDLVTSVFSWVKACGNVQQSRSIKPFRKTGLAAYPSRVRGERREYAEAPHALVLLPRAASGHAA